MLCRNIRAAKSVTTCKEDLSFSIKSVVLQDRSILKFDVVLTKSLFKLVTQSLDVR